MSDEAKVLGEISRKLSQLIVLAKLSNTESLEDTKKMINKDKICCELLALADGSLGATQLKQKVGSATKVSEDTVERRISLLVERGALIPRKEGREVFYENSGLFV